MQFLKYISLILAILFQLLAIVFLFHNVKVAIILFILYGLSILVLLTTFIFERMKEKKEDDENDYSNY